MPFIAALSPALLFGLILGAFAFIRVAAAQHQKTVDAAWKAAGAKLGLAYSRTSGKRGKRKLEGRYRGFPVRINTFSQKSGNSAQTFTRFLVAYPDLGLGLELKHQHFFSTLGRALTGAKDIVVGDKEFDDTVVVGADSAAAVIQFLTRERRQQICRLVASQRRATVRDGDASFVIKGTVSDAAKFQQQLDKLVDLASSFAATADASSHSSFGLHKHKQPAVIEPPASAAPEPAEEALEAPQSPPSPPAEQTAAAPSPHELPPSAPAPAAAPVSVPSELPAPEPAVSSLDMSPHEQAPSRSEPTQLDPPSPDPGPADEPLAPAPPPSDADYEAIRADLFQTDRMSFQVKEHFDATYAGHVATWRGKLERLSSYYSDSVFTDGPGATATIDLEPIQDGSYTKDVHAIVQLTQEQAEAAKALVGAEVTFSGTLMACDGFMRKLFLGTGSLEA